MEKSFLSLKPGDIVAVADLDAHDCGIHRIKIDSVEYDKENITDTNPKGVTYYGDDLDAEDWGEDYITVVNEANFLYVFAE